MRSLSLWKRCVKYTLYLACIFPAMANANLDCLDLDNDHNNGRCQEGLFGNRWLSYGGELNNNHHSKGFGESFHLNKWNVTSLELDWEYIADGPVAIPPSTINDILYFTDFGGGVHAVNSKTGKAIWRINLKNAPYSTPGQYFAFSRNTPLIYGDYLIFGNQQSLFGPDAFYTPNKGILVDSTAPFTYEFNLLNPNNELANGAYLMVINRHTGALLSKIQLDDHPIAMVTQNPVLYDNKVFIGISTQESVIAGFNPAALFGLNKDQIKPYPCCTFEGKVVAVDLAKPEAPELLWTSYTVKPFLVNGQPATLAQRLQNIPLLYSGVSVWGGMPAVDPDRKLVIVGSGNNHHSPDAVVQCIQNQGGDPTGCSSEENHVSSLLALRLHDGSKAWTKSFAVSDVSKHPNYDTWNVSCGGVPSLDFFRDWEAENCPGGVTDPVPGPDLDIGQGAMLNDFIAYTHHKDGLPIFKPVSAVLIGQKNGAFHAVDIENGEKIWNTQVGPAGKNGGFQWNAATDGKRVYGSNANSAHKPWTLVHPAKDSSVQGSTTGGFWSALDIHSGSVLWQTTGSETNPDVNENHGPPLILQSDIMFVGSYTGFLRAFDAAHGTQLWSFDTANTSIGRKIVNTHPTIIKDRVYWGIGYSGETQGALLKFKPKFSIFTEED